MSDHVVESFDEVTSFSELKYKESFVDVENVIRTILTDTKVSNERGHVKLKQKLQSQTRKKKSHQKSPISIQNFLNIQQLNLQKCKKQEKKINFVL